MALKGYLASGFQKLIGASRLKGANDQWVGEYNKLSYTGNTAPISTVSSVFGLNYLDWAPTSSVIVGNTNQLFSVNPTSEAIVVIRNSSPDKYIAFNNAGSVAGSVVGEQTLYVRPLQTVTFIYDVSAARWREVGRTTPYISTAYTVSTSQIAAANARLQSIQISASSDQTVTTITAGIGAQSGDIVQLFIVQATNPITLQQDTTASLANGLIMNGDYVMTKFSTISFIYTGSQWVELSRNMVGGY
jgi:hypothetical protein